MQPKIKVKIFNITIISVRAPTDDKDDTDNSSFYDTLDRVYQTYTKHDALILIVDMEAKVGEGFLTPCAGKYRLYKIPNYQVENYVILRPAENWSLLLPCSRLQMFIFKPEYPQTEKHLTK